MTTDRMVAIDPAVLPPRTRYAKRGSFNIAYQVVGEGSIDIVLSPGWVTHLDLAWDIPDLARFLGRLASFSRLIVFDQRGTGLSDRIAPDELPSLEQGVEDVVAVMDAVGSDRAVLFGTFGGGPVCGLLAATYPERCRALILYGTFARLEPETGLLARIADTPEASLDRLEREWGTEGVSVAFFAPSLMGDEQAVAAYLRVLRSGASPGAARALMQVGYLVDWGEALSAIHVPTLVLHRADDVVVPVDAGRKMAEKIPGATFTELSGSDHLIWVGDQDAVIDQVQAFLGGIRLDATYDRVLGTILVTDVVGSTEAVARMGDLAWRALLDGHRAVVQANLERFGGLEVGTAGDGFLMTFPGPGRAIRCADAIINATRPLGLEIRAGIHSGEHQHLGGSVSGAAIQIAVLVSALAEPGEILVSRAVKDLSPGSGISFENRGAHALRGVDGERELFSASLQT